MQKLFSRLRYPLIQAPMAGVQNEALTIAVCHAGVLGSLPAAMYSVEALDAALTAIRAAVGDAPYNVNFFAHRPPVVSDAQREAWHALLAPHLARFGLTVADIPAAPGRRPFDADALAVVQKHRPPVVSFHFGLPEAPLLQAVRATGAKILSSATSVAEARWLAERGVDGIIVQGLEAGGHRGWFLHHDPNAQSGLFALLPNIRRAVSLPLIAAGGISDATTVRAAMQLGADAVQVGSAFLLADEATTSATHRAALQSPRAEETVLTNLFSGGCARGIVNDFMRAVGAINAAALPFPLAGAAAALLKKAAEGAGNYEYSAFWAGQNAILARPGSAAEIVARLAAGFS
jgi:2-nitropropane dioxygenase family oxidoreductase